MKNQPLAQQLERDGSLFTINGEKRGNVGRFANHSCDWNMVVLPVTCEKNHGVALYTIGFFAIRDIQPMEELVYNYGLQYLNRMDHCLCGSEKCVSKPSKEWQAANPNWRPCPPPVPPKSSLSASAGKKQAASAKGGAAKRLKKTKAKSSNTRQSSPSSPSSTSSSPSAPAPRNTRNSLLRGINPQFQKGVVLKTRKRKKKGEEDQSAPQEKTKKEVEEEEEERGIEQKLSREGEEEPEGGNSPPPPSEGGGFRGDTMNYM